MTVTTLHQRHDAIRAYLHSDQAFDYDNLVSILADSDDEEAGDFDVFVRLAYTISCLSLTPTEMRVAARMIANLAVHVLEFNCAESDEPHDDNVFNALNDAKQNATLVA